MNYMEKVQITYTLNFKILFIHSCETSCCTFARYLSRNNAFLQMQTKQENERNNV